MWPSKLNPGILQATRILKSSIPTPLDPQILQSKPSVFQSMFPAFQIKLKPFSPSLEANIHNIFKETERKFLYLERDTGKVCLFLNRETFPLSLPK